MPHWIITYTEHKEKAYIEESLRVIVEVYDAIPLEDLTDHPDYDLLSLMKRKISELQCEVILILGGKTDTEALSKLVIEIDDAGCDFRDRLTVLLNELRKYPGYEKFCFSSTDINGVHWVQLF